MDNFKDVEFEEVDNSKEKIIRGGALYYNTGQVATMLNVQDSTIRYYSKLFDEILNIEVINKQRKYKQSDIDKLKFIIELKEEGMSLRQIQEYCSEVSFEEGQGVQIKETNPLSIQALAKAMIEEQKNQIAEMEDRIISRIENHIAEHRMAGEESWTSIKAEISMTVDEVINEKIDEYKEVQVEEFKRINEKLDKIAYVSSEEITRQKKQPPNRWWKWLKGK